MRTAFIAVIFVLLAGNLLADPQPWMVKENPNELFAFLAATGDYPGDYEAIIDSAELRLIERRDAQ